jgi:hypothetical protein
MPEGAKVNVRPNMEQAPPTDTSGVSNRERNLGGLSSILVPAVILVGVLMTIAWCGLLVWAAGRLSGLI